MVETITPAVHGGRSHRYFVAASLHVLGAAVSAAALGAILGMIGAIFGAPWGSSGVAAIAGAAALYLARDAFGAPVPLPELRKQVPQWWRSFFSPEVAALLYGLGLGVGFATFLSHGTLVAVAVAAVVSGDPILGAALFVPFGVARGAAVIVAARYESGPLDALGASRVPRGANAVVLATVLGGALALA